MLILQCKRAYALSIFLVVLFSCNSSNQNIPIAYHTYGGNVWKAYIKNQNLNEPDSLITYFKNGVVKEITEFYGVPKDSNAYYIKGGIVYEKAEYLNGFYYLFDSFGNLKRKFKLKKGEMDGTQSEYYKNGNLSVTYTYKNGNLLGEQKEYTEKGVLSFKGFFKGNLMTGVTTYYDTNGILRKHIYSDEKGTIQFIRRYDPSGNITQEDGIP